MTTPLHHGHGITVASLSGGTEVKEGLYKNEEGGDVDYKDRLD